MKSLSTLVLGILGIVALANYRDGTLKTWLNSKFLNKSDTVATPGFYDGITKTSFSALGLPIDGTVTSAFGENRGDHIHSGIDIAAPAGTPVPAVTNGRVIFSGADGNYGLRVDVQSPDGVVTRFAHLLALSVQLGQNVSSGQVIGKVGSTGNSTGPHLHFETRVNGVAVNPASYTNLKVAI